MTVNYKTRFLVFGILSMLCLGLIYGWSIFVIPLEMEFGWGRDQISFAYTLNTCFYGVGCVLSGVWNQKGRYRFSYSLCGLLMIVGYLILWKMTALWQLYLGYSVIIGIANGVGFITVMAYAMRVFPENSGTISGILMMAIGISGMAFSPFLTQMMDKFGVRTAFLGLCIGIGAVLMVSASMVSDHVLQEASCDEGDSGTGVKQKSSLRSKRYWYYVIWATIFTSVGIGFIGQAAACAVDIGATSIQSAYAVSVLSVCNGFGRLIVGRLYDKMPYQRVLNFISLCFVTGTVCLLLSMLTKDIGCIMAGNALIGFGFGGAMVSHSAIVEIFFASEDYALNFGIVNNTALPGSLIGHVIVSMISAQTGSYVMSFVILTVLSVLNLGISTRIK